MIIEKDFDELKKILEDSERANKLVAWSQRTGNLTITEVTEESIIAKYCTGKFCYDVSFFKRDSNGIKRIEYQFKATNYFLLLFFIPVLLYKHEELVGTIEMAIVLVVFMVLFFYVINHEVRKGIYNRIHNRWDDVSL